MAVPPGPSLPAAAVRDRRVALGAIVLLALSLRLLGLGDRLSPDEGYTWLVASAPHPGAFLARLADYENSPPLVFALAALLPRSSEAWLRLPTLVASLAALPVLYAIVRPRLGTRAALLATLALAVAPYEISASDFARGFMLAQLGLLLAFWAALELGDGGRGRWWWVYAAGGALAVWSEYYAALVLAAIAAVLLLRGRPSRLRVLTLGATPLLALTPWIGEIVRAQHRLDVTKVAPVYPTSLSSLRDLVVALAVGEHGSAHGALLRALEAVAVAGALAAAAVVAWRAAEVRPRARELLLVTGGVMAGSLVLFAAGPLAGISIFDQRYLLHLVPLAAIVLAAGCAALPGRAVARVAAIVLLLAGAAVGVRRARSQYEPGFAALRAKARAEHPGTVLTNTPVVAFYLPGVPVVLDRPFGLGRGHPERCRGACRVLEDARFGGLRPGLRVVAREGPFVLGR